MKVTLRPEHPVPTWLWRSCTAAAFVALSVSRPCFAANSTWTGATSTSFATPGNWSAGTPGLPVGAATDVATFTGTTPFTTAAFFKVVVASSVFFMPPFSVPAAPSLGLV